MVPSAYSLWFSLEPLSAPFSMKTARTTLDEPASHARRPSTLGLAGRVDPLLRSRRYTPASLAALLHATDTLALAFGRKLGAMRLSGDSFQVYLSRIEELECQKRIQSRVIALLQARLGRVLENRSRDDYEPTERWQILQLRREACLTQEETGRLFLQSPSTIARWERESRRRPDEGGRVGSLLKVVPPVTRVADAVRALIQAMALMGFGGSAMIARCLYRGGYEVSRAFVQDVLDEPPAVPLSALSALVAPPALAATRLPRAVKARRPMHVALADVTDIPRSGGHPALKLFVFYDVFSRRPLAWRLLDAEPSAEDAIALLEEVIAAHGRPKHFVSDQGPFFTAERFRRRLEALGIKSRFGALHQHGSIALIERFWKTEKGLLLPFLPLDKELTRQDILPLLEASFDFYIHHRPHSALGGRTPEEAFRGLPPPAPAVPPPRGRLGDAWPELHVEITFTDHAARRFPILRRKPGTT